MVNLQINIPVKHQHVNVNSKHLIMVPLYVILHDALPESCLTDHLTWLYTLTLQFTQNVKKDV